MTEYYKKYIKYKLKYLNLKTKGGYRYCSQNAINGINHNAHRCELLDKAYDNFTCNGLRIENTCPVCLVNYADEKFYRCCHRICTICRQRLQNQTCPKCNLPYQGVFQLNGNMWINLNIPIHPIHPQPMQQDEDDETDDEDDGLDIIIGGPVQPQNLEDLAAAQARLEQEEMRNPWTNY